MVEGKKVRLLFVCVQNSCRSQMAEGFARALGGDKVEVFSAGSKPSGAVDPAAIAVMKEAGIDISDQRSKGFKDLPAVDFDYIVTMGCQDVCPIFPAKEELAWDIPDPKGKGSESFRETREQVRRKVTELLTLI